MDYLAQLEKAIIFIENNLREDLKMEEIACSVGYSYFHFHRIFESVVGETVGNYLRTRRLTWAANDLIYTDKRIIDIALEYRFGSQAAFSRAFMKTYRVAPGTYRKNRINTFFGSKKVLTLSKLKHLKKGISIKPRIVEVKKTKIVGIQRKTNISNNMIPSMWQEFNPRIEEIKNRTMGIRGYGICIVEPDYDMTRFSEDTEYNELVGVEVTDFPTIPDGMTAKLLKGGKYAVFTHKGKIANIYMTYDYIWGTWLPFWGFELDLRDDFEFYDERFLEPENERSEIDIYIPVK